MDKSEAYKNLVKEALDSYRTDEKKRCGRISLLPPDITIFADGDMITERNPEICFCREINLYTYWQGFGYAEHTPEIKYLLVGQDWGNPFNVEVPFFRRILRMNDGDKDARYLLGSDDPNAFKTDKNLIELFRVLGYGKNGEPDISEKRYSELFFTNFCLGYRSGKDSGGMTVKQMMLDAIFFSRLCSILQPESILCLGKNTFECVYRAIQGKNVKMPDDFSKSYNDFLDNHVPKKLQYLTESGICSSRIFPLAHCGALGTANRSLEKQKKDWEKILE